MAPQLFLVACLSRITYSNSLSTYNLLKKQIAIPILLRRSLSDYRCFAKQLLMIVLFKKDLNKLWQLK